MDNVKTAKMTLTRVSSGISSQLSGQNGTLSYGSNVSAVAGFKMEQAKDDAGHAYDIVSVVGEVDVNDPASIIVEVFCKQDASFDEVDLEARYQDIPAGTSLEVASTESVYSIPRETLPNQSGLVSAIDTNVSPFDASLTLKLWITEPDALQAGSKVSLQMFSIEGGGGGLCRRRCWRRSTSISPTNLN